MFTDNGLRAPQMSFKSSWIQDMKIFLPTLAVTVDDSILAFLDTLSKLYANSRAIKDSGLSQGTLTGATPAQEVNISMPSVRRTGTAQSILNSSQILYFICSL